MLDVNLTNVSANVIELLNNRAQEKETMYGVLMKTNEPVIEAIKQESSKSIKHLEKQTSALLEMRDIMSIVSETVTVSNDLMYDLLEGDKDLSLDGSGMAEVILKIESGDNADNLVEELSVLTQNEGDFLKVVGHFDTLGDIIQEKFSGLEGTMEQLQTMTEAAGGLTNESQATGKGMLMAVGGMALLGVTAGLLSDVINPMTFAGISAGLYMLKIAIDGFTEDNGKGLLLASSGMAVLSLAIMGFNYVDYSGLLKAALALGGMTLAIKLMSESVGENIVDLGKGLLLFSASMGALAISTMLFDMVSPTAIFKMGGALLAVTGALLVMGSSRNVEQGAKALLIASGSIALLALSTAAFDIVSLGAIGKTALALGTFGLAFYAIGQAASPILKGALTSIVMSGSVMLLGMSLEKISDANIDVEKVLKFGLMTGALTAGFAAISLASAAIFTGSAAVAVMSGSMFLLTGALNAASSVQMTEEDGQNFVNSIKYVGKGLYSLAWDVGIVTATTAAAVAVPLSLAVTPLTLSMRLLGSTKMPSQQTIDGFGYAVTGIANAFGSLSLIQLGKIGIATPVLLGMGLSTVTMAKSIRAFTEIAQQPEVVEVAVNSIDTFVTSFASTMEVNSTKFEGIQSGIRSLSGIGSLMTGIATGVQKMANLEFTESEVVNGKLVVKSTRKMTPEDFSNMGQSVAMVINALTEPLAKVGAQGSGATFSLFGYEVFSVNSNEVQQGIQALSGIGNVFNPIVNVVKTFSENNIDSTKVEEFGLLLAQLLASTTETIGSFVLGEDSETKLGHLERYGKVTSDFFGFFGQTDLNPAVDAVGRLGENLMKVGDALSGIDIEKLNKLNDIIYNTTHFEEANIEMMQRLIDSLYELMDKVGSSSGGGITNNNQTTTQTTNVEGGQGTAVNTTGEENPVAQQQAVDLSGLQDKIEELLDFMESGRLRGSFRLLD